jgi:hypothetical protein
VWNGNIGDPGALERGQGADVERRPLGQEVEGEEAHQHQRRAEEGEEEELDRCVLAVRAAPDPDHEEHREEDDLEEDEEEHEVEGDEGPDHPDLEQEDQGQERLRVVRLREVVQRVDDAQRHDHHGQDQQRQRDAVDPEVVPGVDDRDPLLVDLELHLGCVPEVEVDEDADPDRQGHERREEGDDLDRSFLRPGDEQDDRHPDERGEDREGQRPVIEPVHVPCDPLS